MNATEHAIDQGGPPLDHLAAIGAGKMRGPDERPLFIEQGLDSVVMGVSRCSVHVNL